MSDEPVIVLGHDKDGQPKKIPVHHTGVFGQTGVGKTRELKFMARQAVDAGYSVLIVDSKIPHPEFKGFGVDVPLYLEESTDADIFRSLIEGMRTEGRGDMQRYRGGFIELTEPADAPMAENFAQIGVRLEEKMHDKKIRGSTRTMYSEIRRDFRKLIDLLGEHKFSKHLEIPRPLARMETRVLPNVALQGLVVKSVVNEILRREKDLIILVDEAPNFVHQKYYNPAKSALMALDNQGRSKRLFGWYSGQTLTGFDKANMKNVWYYLIGREMETNEAKDAHAVQTYKRLTVDEIRRLGVQEFVVVTPNSTDKIRVPDLTTDGRLEAGEKGKGPTTQNANPIIHDNTTDALKAPPTDWEAKTGEVAWATYDKLRNDFVDTESKLLDAEKKTTALEYKVNNLADLLRSEKQTSLEWEAKAGEALHELETLRPLVGAFTGLREYIDQRIRDLMGDRVITAIANQDGQVQVDAEDAEVVVFENTKIEKLNESSMPGRLCILMARQQWTGPLERDQIAQLITKYWGRKFGGGKDRRLLDDALASLSRRPYLLCERVPEGWTPTEKGKSIKVEEVVAE